MEVDHNGCNGNSTNTNSNVRGKKRSGNHLDHVEDLPPEKSSTDVTSVSQRRHPTHFEVSSLYWKKSEPVWMLKKKCCFSKKICLSIKLDLCYP